MNIAFIIDPLAKLNPKTDGSLALAQTAKEMGHNVFLVESNDLILDDGSVLAEYYELPTLNKSEELLELATCDVVLMRRDPPFDMDYIYLTYLLEEIQKANPKCKVLNPPKALRSFNEKMAILNFPGLIPRTLVTKKTEEILSFSHEYPQGIILKPLNEKGGKGVTWLKSNDSHPTRLKKIKNLTGGDPGKEKNFIMVQEYLEEASKGDKRITVVNGKIINCILRVPKKGDFRGNISAGAKAYASNPTENELKAVKEIGTFLKKQGIFFAGLDFIGKKLTEFNITSPIVGFSMFPESPQKIIQELERI